jgi:tetratricopeptide (TPR) repeat protein
VEAGLQQGRTLASQGRFAEALPLLAEACSTGEGCRLALDTASQCFRETADFDNAVVFFHEVAEIYPQLAARALTQKGIFQYRAHDQASAVETLRASLDVKPTPLAHAWLGTILLEMQEETEALASMQRALALAPGDPYIQFTYGRALRLTGRYGEAGEILGELVAAHPENGDAWANLGRVRLQLGNVEGARRALRACLRVEPTNVEALFTLGRIALREGDLRTAEAITMQLRKVENSLGRGERLE